MVVAIGGSSGTGHEIARQTSEQGAKEAKLAAVTERLRDEIRHE
jgi:NADP-dependent 3-hydroxy acid dehydrogenase YdfG